MGSLWWPLLNGKRKTEDDVEGSSPLEEMPAGTAPGIAQGQLSGHFAVPAALWHGTKLLGSCSPLSRETRDCISQLVS